MITSAHLVSVPYTTITMSKMVTKTYPQLPRALVGYYCQQQESSSQVKVMSGIDLKLILLMLLDGRKKEYI